MTSSFKRRGVLLLIGLAVIDRRASPPVGIAHLAAQSPAGIDYARDVQPLLRANCYSCHGPAQRSGNFRIDRRGDAMPNRVGANGARIVPGQSDASKVYLRISGTGGGIQMPPTGALRPEEIATIKLWIDQGVDWPDALANDTPSPPQDPQAVRLIDALRNGRAKEFAAVLQASPQAAHRRGAGGSTPLMYAALYGDAGAMRRLLDRGADVNARNDAGATALMWAVDDVRTTRVLLEYGADPNVRSEDNQTALFLAAGRAGAADVVEALVSAGASVAEQNVFGRAALAGDEQTLRLLLARGAGSRDTARDVASARRAGCQPCIDLLLASAAPDVRSAALVPATVAGATPATATDTPAQSAHADSTLRVTPRAALEKSLPLLQHADGVFLRTAGCVSCHNNSLFLMAARVTGASGVHVNAEAVTETKNSSGAYIESWRERVLQDIGIPGGVDTISYTLAGLAAAKYPPDQATDALARFLWRRQAADGGWKVASNRPPIESSDFTVTALSIRAIQAYAPAPQKQIYGQALTRGVTWLRQALPSSTEDHAFQVLGLAWSHDRTPAIRAAAQRLVALQRADGGWSQIPTLPSDAYATGQALAALVESGALSVKDPIYQRGTAFLLQTQLEDGSWHVRSRTRTVQPYFDSQFPHGRDQFISAAATNWAAIALSYAVRR